MVEPTILNELVDLAGRHKLIPFLGAGSSSALRRRLTPAVTDRYVHNRGTNLERVANVIQLFPAALATIGWQGIIWLSIVSGKLPLNKNTEH